MVLEMFMESLSPSLISSGWRAWSRLRGRSRLDRGNTIADLRGRHGLGLVRHGHGGATVGEKDGEGAAVAGVQAIVLGWWQGWALVRHASTLLRICST